MRSALQTAGETAYPLEDDVQDGGDEFSKAGSAGFVTTPRLMFVGDAGKASPARAAAISDPRAATSVADATGGHLKYALDVVVAGIALVLLAPLMAAVALAIRFSGRGGPALYAHPRIGHDGRMFKCLKFRTMALDGDAILERHLALNAGAKREWDETRKLTHDPRITPLGHFLRKTSIDELPQLLNVLRGEMSCVGPRPIVPAELPRYGIHARHYLKARPGLTGIWQTQGRSSTGYRTRVAMDTLYVRKWSFRRDVGILLATIPALLRFGDAK